MLKIHFLPQDMFADAESGTTILDAARNMGLSIDAPCGGNGTCGKCKVIINGQEVKACQYKVTEDVEVTILEKAHDHNILKTGKSSKFKINPIVKSFDIEVEKPVIGGIKSDCEAIIQAIFSKTGMMVSSIDKTVMLSLHEILVDTEYRPEAVIYENKLINLRRRGEPLLAVSFDIGTTTVVGYLLDLRTGKELGSASMLNPQAVYGADVIQRSGYAGEHGVGQLNKCIIDALNSLISQAVIKTNADIRNIMLVTLVGNTCMSHLFQGISPVPLTVAPYLPVRRDKACEKAADFGIVAGNGAMAIMLPNIGGFVGADTVGAILSCEMDLEDKTTLMIDIGTNGELALGNKNRLETCSTAAGPAFEGAMIECGMRGAFGAIDHVKIVNGEVKYSVIGGEEAIGICGSGLIDVVSELVKCGVIDDGGRIVSEDELEGDTVRLSKRLSEYGPNRRFNISDKVYITQKDVREVQLAKAAMAAGIKILMQKLNIGYEEIEKVMIAGAFGNYMDPAGACGISLIPAELSNRIVGVGNAAGLGAQAAALDKAVLKRADDIALTAGYVELAVEPEFQDIFVEELEF